MLFENNSNFSVTLFLQYAIIQARLVARKCTEGGEIAFGGRKVLRGEDKLKFIKVMVIFYFLGAKNLPSSHAPNGLGLDPSPPLSPCNAHLLIIHAPEFHLRIIRNT